MFGGGTESVRVLDQEKDGGDMYVRDRKSSRKRIEGLHDFFEVVRLPLYRPPSPGTGPIVGGEGLRELGRKGSFIDFSVDGTTKRRRRKG